MMNRGIKRQSLFESSGQLEDLVRGRRVLLYSCRGVSPREHS